MTATANPGDGDGLRDLWVAYVVLGGCLALDELTAVVEEGAPLPPAERELLAAAAVARQGR